MKKSILILVACLVYQVQVLAQCEFEQSTFESISKKYKKQFGDLQRDSEDIAEDAPDPNDPEAALDMEFKVDMNRQDFSLDIPQITMKDRKISFDVPQVTMKMKTMKFKKPVTKMVPKKIGQKPEIHGWTIKWKDIITSVPEVTMKMEEIKTKIPEITFKTTNLITAIPEFKMVQTNLSLDLPSITVTKISAEVRKIEDRANQIDSESERLQQEQRKEMSIAIHESFECQRNQLNNTRNNLNAEFSNAILEIEKNIKLLIANGLNPESVVTDSSEKINLIELKENLLLREKDAFKEIDDATNKLNEEERKVLGEFVKES